MAHTLNIVVPFDPPPSASPIDGHPLKVRFEAGVLQNAEMLPSRMIWKGRGRPMPDFDHNHIVNVSSRAKDVIEKLEPGVHRFEPIEYVNTSKKFVENRYFLFVGQRIDAVSATSPQFVRKDGKFWRPWFDFPSEERPADFDPNVRPRLIFERDKIAGRQMWIETSLGFGDPIYLSDAMATAFMDEGLTGVRPTPIEEV